MGGRRRMGRGRETRCFPAAPGAVSKSRSVPICSWGQIWEMTAPLRQPWGDHVLTLSGAEGHGENSDLWSASPPLSGGLASSYWCHFDMVQDPLRGNPCSALIRSCLDKSTGSVLQAASAGCPWSPERDGSCCHWLLHK